MAGALQIVGEGGEAVGAGLLFGCALLGRRLFDEEPLFGGEIDAVAHLRHQHALPRRQGFELGLEADGLGVGLLGHHLGQEMAHLVAHAALIVDQAIQPAFQLVAFVQLIGELEDAARDELQIHARVVVARRSEAHGVVEPRGALAQQIDHRLTGRRLALRCVRRRGVVGAVAGEVRLRRQRHAKIERGAVAQLGIRAGLVARREKRRGGGSRIAGGQSFKP